MVDKIFTKEEEKNSKLLKNLDTLNKEIADKMLDKEVLKLLIKDFKTYVAYVFNYLNLNKPSPVQNILAEELGKNPERLVINAFRGFGKTIITAVYVSWRLLRNPDEKILIVGGNTAKSAEISVFVRRLLSLVPILKHLEPSGDMVDSVNKFDVKGTTETTTVPSVKIVGIFGMFTGSRATLVLADDVETPENATTEELRHKLKAKIEEFSALLIPEKKCSMIFLGTPQSSNSVYKDLPFNTLIIPIEVPEDPAVYKGNLHPWVLSQGIPGTPVDKIRFPEKEINKRKLEYATSSFKLQFMLDTLLSDEEKFPLKLKYLSVMSLNSKLAPEIISHSNSLEYKYKSNELENVGFDGDGFYRPSYIGEKWLKYEYKFMAIDPSGKGKDETACIVCGVLNGNVFILNIFASKDGASNETLDKIASIAKQYEIEKIIIESNFGVYKELLEKHLHAIYNCEVEAVSSKGQKEKRIIETIEPVLRSGAIIIDFDVVKQDIDFIQSNEENISYSFLRQLTNITIDRNSLSHDDRIDALSMCIAHLSGKFIVNDVIESELRKQREWEKFLHERIYGKNNELQDTISFIEEY